MMDRNKGKENKMKIVILDGYTENPGDLSWEGFESLGDLTVYDRTAKEEVIDRIGDAEAVIVNKTPLDKAVFEACPQIRYVGVLATGYNVIDIKAARERGIPVCNIPTYGTTAVAQMTFALLLEICHHVREHSEAVKKENGQITQTGVLEISFDGTGWKENGNYRLRPHWSGGRKTGKSLWYGGFSI